MVRDRDRLLRIARAGHGRVPSEGHARLRRQMRPLLARAAGSGEAGEASDAVPAVFGRGGVGADRQAGGVMRRSFMTLGVVIGLVVLAADQLSKWWVLHGLDLPALGQVVLLPVL